MDQFETPIYSDTVPPRGGITQADFTQASPWGNQDLSYNWINTEFPALHIHDHWELFIIVKGNIIHHLNGKSYSLKEGDAALIRPSDMHAFYFDRPKQEYQQLNLLIKDDFIHKLFDLYKSDLYNQLLLPEENLSFKLPEIFLQNLTHKARSLQMVQNDAVEENVFQTKIIVHQILAYFFEQRRPYTDRYPSWLKLLLSHLNSDACKYKARDIAKLSPFGHSRLTELFKHYTGQTINQYLLNLKLQHAKNLLAYTNMTTLEISLEIGFTSLSHFNHVFKERFNMTPSVYRSSMKTK